MKKRNHSTRGGNLLVSIQESEFSLSWASRKLEDHVSFSKLGAGIDGNPSDD